MGSIQYSSVLFSIFLYEFRDFFQNEMHLNCNGSVLRKLLFVQNHGTLQRFGTQQIISS